MHLRNGLNILEQGRRNGSLHPSHESIGHVLYRFDLQAMTFSDNTSPYKYEIDNEPGCPQIPDRYTNNIAARNDLVRLLRCMLWISGIADYDPGALQHPVWLQAYADLMQALKEWEVKFDVYLNQTPHHEQEDHKTQGGNILLQMYIIITRIIAASGAGMKTELAWDGFIELFQSVVELAETLPILQPHTPPLSRSSTPNTHSFTEHPLGTPPARISSPSYPNAATISFQTEASPLAKSAEVEYTLNVADQRKRAPISFSPSFELSPIVPLFLTITRCRDPFIRRRALALLLNYRRREGVWDSLGAALVGAECVKKEEDLQGVDIGSDNWLPLNPRYTVCHDVLEWQRVQDIFIGVRMADGEIDLTYSMTNGVKWSELRTIDDTPTVTIGREQMARIENYSVSYKC